MKKLMDYANTHVLDDRSDEQRIGFRITPRRFEAAGEGKNAVEKLYKLARLFIISFFVAATLIAISAIFFGKFVVPLI